jgi:hypothetical protein
MCENEVLLGWKLDEILDYLRFKDLYNYEGSSLPCLTF